MYISNRMKKFKCIKNLTHYFQNIIYFYLIETHCYILIQSHCIFGYYVITKYMWNFPLTIFLLGLGFRINIRTHKHTITGQRWKPIGMLWFCNLMNFLKNFYFMCYTIVIFWYFQNKLLAIFILFTRIRG